MMKVQSFEEFEKTVNEVAPGADVKVRWTTGGMTGGSCWDDSDSVHDAIESEPEPKDEDLDRILEAVIPDLTFLEYRKLHRVEIYERGDDVINEYYGNYRTEDWRKLNLEKLYNALVDISGAR